MFFRFAIFFDLIFQSCSFFLRIFTTFSPSILGIFLFCGDYYCVVGNRCNRCTLIQHNRVPSLKVVHSAHPLRVRGSWNLEVLNFRGMSENFHFQGGLEY